MKARAHVLVSGLVQGVFFRHETRNCATRLELTGWVRNLPDRSVEAVFEGEKEKVEEAIAFCKRGPPHAEVHSVEIQWEDWKGEFKDFRITY